MAAIEAITFDLGDTVTDLGEGRPEYEARGLVRAGKVYDVLAAAQVVLGERAAFCARLAHFIEERYAAAVSRRQGLTLGEALAAFYAEEGLPVADGLLEESAETWCAPGPHMAALRVGAVETLAALRDRGLRLGVISNTIQPGRYLDAGLARRGLLDLFAATVYSSDIGVAKPHPGIFRAALAALQVEPEHAVHVGDRLANDVAGAHAVGMRAVLVEVPQRVESDPEIVPDARIRELPELLAVVEGWAAVKG